MKQLNIPSDFEQFEATVGKVLTISYPDKQGATSKVTFIHSENGQFVCKSATKSKYKGWLSQEAQIMKQLNEETSLPIPTFYQFLEKEKESHLLMSLGKGITLREALKKAKSDEEKYVLCKSFGDLLKQLHETLPPASWRTQESWLDLQLEKAAYYLESYNVDGDQKLLDQLKQHKPTPSKPCLIHGDCTIDNVLVSNGNVHTFIDLGGATYGDPRYDIALAIRSIKNNEAMLRSFYKGYERQIISEEEFNYFDGGLYEFF
ncbi:aminoglycoside phosphotransferase family protein [Psychrobacillus vulpis]|uniref:Aminoglycoside phosphotransferase family protein n=1 Tax=Psychrobacillus vulpis TaxID=2325572 RepID=A0A544TP28_9BACI|nr:aminoglycoside phosphotransferase family protein [Psychrobacillus vulpis]TQR19169.1 aminoglycoside phosphotransferase family protein [Psychrobacillus vulpis]